MLVPSATPVTKPELSTVANDGLSETHGLIGFFVSDPNSNVVDPTQTFKLPVIVGKGFITKGRVLAVALVPHILLAFTVISPDVFPAVAVIVLVPCPAVMVQSAGVVQI